MMLDYEVVIPSRRRSDKLKGWREIFPYATLYVHESEFDDYAAVCGEDKVRTHNVTSGLWAIHRRLREESNHEVVVTIDDDVHKVKLIDQNSARHHNVDGPDRVRQVIENTIRVSKDLGVMLFGWDIQGNPSYYEASKPFSLTTPCDTAFGTIGRDILPDASFWTSGGIDLNLQAMLKGRVVFRDTRYHFDNGKVSNGTGGLQGMRTRSTEDAATEMLTAKWGSKYFNRGKSSTPGKMGGHTMRICVERKNALASTK